jgi:hypothetical protein
MLANELINPVAFNGKNLAEVDAFQAFDWKLSQTENSILKQLRIKHGLIKNKETTH